MSVVEREKWVGDFKVDVLAEDGAGNLVVVENQLEPTDHDHLGKVLTYLANLEAKAAVWISANPRPEHVKAISWLNEATPPDTRFYLVQLSAYRIGNSDPAPLFSVVSGPSDSAKAFGEEKKELAERHVLRMKFWEELLQRAKEKNVKWHAGVSPRTDNWLGTGAGKSGLAFNYLVWLEGKTGVELDIDTGDYSENKRIFDELKAEKDEIERSFGQPLLWERLDNRRRSRIRHVIEMGGLKDTDDWSSIQDAMIDAMDRLVRAVKRRIERL